MGEKKICPHCGETLYLFSIEHARYTQYYTADGEPDGYGELDQIGTSLKRKSTPVYCQNCERRVGTLERILEGKG